VSQPEPLGLRYPSIPFRVRIHSVASLLMTHADDPSDMASPVNRKSPQPPEGSEYPPMDLETVAKQRKA